MQPETKDKLFKRIIKALWILFGTGILLIFLLFVGVYYDIGGLFGSLPSYKALENPEAENDLASELYSGDGVMLGKYYRYNRTQVTYEQLSPQLVETLMSTEDLRFREHAGIDLRGLIRAAFGMMTGRFMGGGSTVTMQTAENLYGTMNNSEGRFSHNGIITKIKEYIISIELERNFTKDEILAMYFNTISFGHNTYGISTAAKVFFNKSPDSLSYPESALLVGMLNAPTRYSPILNPENALNKRTEILYNLFKYDFISREEYDSMIMLPLGLDYRAQDHLEGPAPYFRQEIRSDLLKWCNERNLDLFESGLKIHTTIDSKLQMYAEEAVKEHMSFLQELFNEHWKGRNPWIDEEGREIKGFLEKAIKRTDRYRSLARRYADHPDSIDIVLNTPKPMTVFSWKGDIDTLMSPMDSLKYYKHFLQTGFMAMDPHSGQIRAWVGGIDFRYFKYDHVKQGKRQPGSTFKPVVYTAAIDHGYSPCYKVKDAPVTFITAGQPPYTPENYEKTWTNEDFTIRRGLANSKNSITAFLMKQMTPEVVVKYARDLGFESHLDAVPSLALGVSDVSIYELIGAYATFVNQGTYIKPYYITRIEDKNGNLLQEFPAVTKESLSEETAYLMIHMLRGATEERGGTALGLSRDLRIDNEIGAKTGTTQNGSDGWFVGLTKDLVAGAWTGGDDRPIHFRTSALGQGARTAMPLWDKFMTKVYADSTLGYTKGPFPRPIKPLPVEINCQKYEDPSYNPLDSLDQGLDDRLDQDNIY